jgi:hypothetical protein
VNVAVRFPSDTKGSDQQWDMTRTLAEVYNDKPR